MGITPIAHREPRQYSFAAPLSPPVFGLLPQSHVKAATYSISAGHKPFIKAIEKA
jgi:hypothetical protein